MIPTVLMRWSWCYSYFFVWICGFYCGAFHLVLSRSLFSCFFSHFYHWATTRQNVSSGVSDQARHKSACAATEASKSLEISAIESRDIILSKQRTTKVLIRLRRCAGWSAPLVFAYDIRHIFSWPGSIVNISLAEERAGLCIFRAFVCCFFLHVLIFVLFLFPLVSGVGCGFDLCSRSLINSFCPEARCDCVPNRVWA